MADIEVEEIVVVSDVSEGSSSGDDSGVGGRLLPEPIRGVRNCRVPPFVTKLYDLVSNKAIDSTISWVSNHNVAQMENQVSGGASSFAIWNEVDFGFKKVSWDRHEYANEWFQEGKPHLLKHIKRRNKQIISDNEKLTHELKKLESESNEIDNELYVFKEHVDNTISNQQKILRSIANVIKATFDHNHETTDNATPSLIMVGQQSRETSEICESSFVPMRLLPASVLSSPNSRLNSYSTKGTPVLEEKDYGITDAQKDAIISRLKGPSNAVWAGDMYNWVQGEHNFFEDQVKYLDLDYDYSIEDVDSDEESGTAQFFANQIKLGKQKAQPRRGNFGIRLLATSRPKGLIWLGLFSGFHGPVVWFYLLEGPS
ncbi:hypothetical protein L1987_58773 [Smallanthus sonchifolius]|uniref:Uncharacterized protein n=1 Tax=Smallanthus sonchifolius TaxID=185202 RepID=A0ACB9D3M0_9ASTR|nr:hypothetical protein L1987_58773 [Smallanthus sonchifolius]